MNSSIAKYIFIFLFYDSVDSKDIKPMLILSKEKGLNLKSFGSLVVKRVERRGAAVRMMYSVF